MKGLLNINKLATSILERRGVSAKAQREACLKCLRNKKAEAEWGQGRRCREAGDECNATQWVVGHTEGTDSFSGEPLEGSGFLQVKAEANTRFWTEDWHELTVVLKDQSVLRTKREEISQRKRSVNSLSDTTEWLARWNKLTKTSRLR